MKTINVTLTFNEHDLNVILEGQYYGEEDPPRVDQLSNEQFAKLASIMQATAPTFVSELVETSADCDEWLGELMEEVMYDLSTEMFGEEE